jgi:hypothetical protein
MIPPVLSNEADQDSGPMLAVHPDRQLLVAGSFSSRTTPPPSSLYVSQDGGWTWHLESIVPAGRVKSQSYSFSGSSRKLYGAIMIANGPAEVVVSVIQTVDPVDGNKMEPILRLASGSAIANEPFIQANQFDKDRIYVGQNYLGHELGRQTASVQVSTDGGKTFKLWGLETRPAVQDGPLVQPATSKDGTVYVAFMRFASSRGKPPNVQFTGDVVVCRDDHGATQPNPFTALRDIDGQLGRIVARDRNWLWDSMLGGQRIESILAIAVDPTHSSRVVLAFADFTGGQITIHLRTSEDRGNDWSERDLLAIPSATNAAVAIADDGGIGFLYQQLIAAGSLQEQWETHLRTSDDRGATWTDFILNQFLTADSPKAFYQPLLGDRGSLMAVGNDFYGVFSALNKPEARWFPWGAQFQRQNRLGKLLTSKGNSEVTPSIDPFFVHLKRGVPELELGWSERPHFLLSTGILALLAAFFAVLYARSKSLNLDNLLEEKVRGPVLANYSGFLLAGFTDSSGAPLVESDPGAPCRLEVRLAQKPAEGMRAEPVDLRGGDDLHDVTFKIVVDGDAFQLTGSNALLVVPRRGGARIPFEAVAPHEAGNHAVFVQAFQKTRLVQVVSAILRIRESASSE